MINAGGLINVANELEGYDKEKAFNQAEKIYDTLMGIFKRSKKEQIDVEIEYNFTSHNIDPVIKTHFFSPIILVLIFRKTTIHYQKTAILKIRTL